MNNNILKSGELGGEKLTLSACIYLLYVASYLLHLPARINLLAVIRFDALLALLLIVLISFKFFSSEKEHEVDSVSKSLLLLVAYIIFSLPLVEWPGSVIKQNFYPFLKAILFYFFTIQTIKNTKQLKLLLFVFIGCQIFRVIEPLWLHITTGYWGSATYIGTGFSDRLAGSPYDIINPNGLAFIIVLTLPLLHFLLTSAGFMLKTIYVIFAPLLLYALVLTQSRSGLIGLFIILLYIYVRSNKKFLVIGFLVLASIVIWSNLDEQYRNRYLSINIFNSDITGHASAEGRIEGWISGFKVFLNRPIFGHGLGTSLEAGWHAVGQAQIAHNMYIEVLQELGIIGFGIVMLFMKNVLQSCYFVRKNISALNLKNHFFLRLSYSIESISYMLLIFSLASYGLSTYTWYFFGGLSAVVFKLSISDTPENAL